MIYQAFILVAAFGLASAGVAEHYRGAAQTQQPQQQAQPQIQQPQKPQAPQTQTQSNGKSREAAEKLVKDGDEVRKSMTKSSEQFNTGVTKLIDNFSNTVSSLAKSAGEEDFKENFKQLSQMASATAADATSSVVDLIVAGFQEQAAVGVKKAQVEAAAAVAMPQNEPVERVLTRDKVLSSSDSTDRNSPIAQAQAATSATSNALPAQTTNSHSSN